MGCNLQLAAKKWQLILHVGLGLCSHNCSLSNVSDKPDPINGGKTYYSGVSL